MKSAIETFAASLPFKLNLATKAAVIGADGRVLRTSDPGAAASVAKSVASVREFFGERWQDGDVAVLNDPDRGATHVCQLTAVAPIYRHDRIAAWAVFRCNVADLGGWSPGGYSPQAVDRWAEAARFEPAKLFLAGRVRREVADVLLLNSRTPNATRRLALRVAEAAVELGRSTDLSDARFQAELAELRRALDALPKRDAQATAVVRTPQGIASPGDVAVRLSRAAGKLKVEISAPAVSPSPVNLCLAASSDVVLTAVVEGLGLENLETGALVELMDIDVKGGLLAAALPTCVGMGRETSGAALYAACAAALSQLNGRKGEAQAWLAREVAGEMDWSSGRLTAAAAAMLLAAETEAKR